jgi:hypothetical protein
MIEISKRGRLMIFGVIPFALFLLGLNACSSAKTSARGAISSLCQQKCLNQGPTGQSTGDCLRECDLNPSDPTIQTAPPIENPRSKIKAPVAP